MARTTTTVSGLFSQLLRPLTDAVYAETGKRLTVPGWGRVLRSLAATGLRMVADALHPAAVPNPAKGAPVAPVKADGITAEAVADVKPAAVPAGWDVVETWVPAETEVVKPVKPARKPRSKPAATRRPVPVPSANQVTKRPTAKAKGKASKAAPVGKAKAGKPVKEKAGKAQAKRVKVSK